MLSVFCLFFDSKPKKNNKWKVRLVQLYEEIRRIHRAANIDFVGWTFPVNSFPQYLKSLQEPPLLKISNSSKLASFFETHNAPSPPQKKKNENAYDVSLNLTFLLSGEFIKQHALFVQFRNEIFFVFVSFFDDILSAMENAAVMDWNLRDL